MSAPADLVRMTRKTFEMAEMNIPEPIATPLAWFTAAVLLVPRRHSVETPARSAAARYRGPLLLIHGAQDHGVPVAIWSSSAGRGRQRAAADDPPVETLVLPDFGHRWLYEDAGCRRKTRRSSPGGSAARSRRARPANAPPPASSSARPTRSTASARWPARPPTGSEDRVIN
jgi:fermentation-respiration switch protein FrsA (DUF1100 family)